MDSKQVEAAASVANALSADEPWTALDGQNTKGDSAAELSYQEELLLWLQQHKKYPARLQRRGIEGVVMLSMTLGDGGELLRYMLVSSSGEPLLDKAAIQLLKDAEPMPALPPSLQARGYQVAVPIHFAIR